MALFLPMLSLEIIRKSNTATEMPFTHLFFLFVHFVTVVFCVFKIFYCSAVAVSYFGGKGLFTPYRWIDYVDDVYYPYKHHKCNNGHKPYFAEPHCVFRFIAQAKKTSRSKNNYYGDRYGDKY
jgi:hypothetical protein